MKETSILIVFLAALFTTNTLLSQSEYSTKQKKGKYALTYQNSTLTEFKYDTIEIGFSDYFVAKLDNKFGVLNSVGNEIVSFDYEEIDNFYQGKLKVKFKDKYGIIDTAGNVICKINYEEIDHIGIDSSILVKTEFNWKYIKNNEIIDRDTFVFKYPDRIAIFGNCKESEDKEKCSKENILNSVYKHLKYPLMARENNVSGIIVVSFWVSKEGELQNIQLLKDIGADCGKEGIKAVKKMQGWKPAIKDGNEVWSELTLPLRFALK